MKSDQYLPSEHFWAKKLPDGWRYEFLEDLISNTVDNRGRTVPTSDSGIPLIATNCISNESLYPKFKDIRYVSQKIHDEWFRNGHTEPNDIIFVNKGSPGNVCLVPSPVNFCFAQDMIGLKIDNKKINFRYLLAVLRTKFMQEQIFAFHVGTLIPHLKKDDLKRIIIPIPPQKLEIFIGEYYISISRQIENLQNQNKVLEQIAQAVFKSWFIDFDGVTEFEDSELGQIPKGWKVKKISDLTDVSIGRTPPRNENQWFSKSIGIKWASIKDLGSSSTFIFKTSEKLTQEALKKFRIPIIEKGMVLLSFKLTVGKVAIASEKMVSNEAIAHFKIIDSSLNNLILLMILKNFNYDTLGSTSSIATAINSKNIRDMKIILPLSNLSEKFRKITSEIFNQIFTNSKKIQDLTDMRDSLLPKLMSGEIRI